METAGAPQADPETLLGLPPGSELAVLLLVPFAIYVAMKILLWDYTV